jgi:hypothetical protein
MGFWAELANVASVLQVVTVLLSGYAALRLWQQNRRLKELALNTPRKENFNDILHVHDGVKSSAPVALVISLLTTSESLKPTIDTFLRTKGWSMPVEELHLNGINGQAGLEEYVNLLRQKRRLFDAQGYTEVHLFIAGPVQAGTIAGSMLDNWIPVKLYHKPNPPGPAIYEYWMPLL